MALLALRGLTGLFASMFKYLDMARLAWHCLAVAWQAGTAWHSAQKYKDQVPSPRARVRAANTAALLMFLSMNTVEHVWSQPYTYGHC